MDSFWWRVTRSSGGRSKTGDSVSLWYVRLVGVLPTVKRPLQELICLISHLTRATDSILWVNLRDERLGKSLMMSFVRARLRLALDTFLKA